jgi:translation elongation factor P
MRALVGVVKNEFGDKYVEPRAYKTKSKNAQEAHEAVRPTDPAKQTAGKDSDEQRLYELIRIRALASQMASAAVLRTSIKIEADADIPVFGANGSRVIFPGWLALDTRARGEDVELPLLAKGEKVDVVTLGSLEKQTEPPNRYTEAGLIKELEKRGIGRPSTYASTMNTIVNRGYVEKQGRTLMPTATGMVVSGFLEEHFAEYISDTFTAEMEDNLDEIARGEREYEPTLREFYVPFHKAVEAKDSLPKATSLGPVPAEFPCPLCGATMEFKLGRGGVFMSCTRYPDCTGARQEDGTELKSDEPIVMQTKLRNVITGKVMEYSFKFGEKIEEADVSREKANFLYADDSGTHFMNNETFETVDFDKEVTLEQEPFLKEGTEVQILRFNGKPVSIELPIKVELIVTEAPPGIKGDSGGSVTKPVTLDTGLVVQAPLFIKEGEVIRVDTRTGEYVERVN